MCIPKVPWNQRFKPLLSCCIPKLQSIALAFVLYILREEIDANSGLDS